MHAKRMLRFRNDPALPRLKDGGVALCKIHQQAVSIAGGMNIYLASALKRMANEKLTKEQRQGKCPKCGEQDPWWISNTTYMFMCRLCRKKWGNRTREHGNLSLSDHERVLRLIRDGASDATIASETGLHRRTIQRRRVMITQERELPHERQDYSEGR